MVQALAVSYRNLKCNANNCWKQQEMHFPAGTFVFCASPSNVDASTRQVAFQSYTSAIHVLSLLGNSPKHVFSFVKSIGLLKPCCNYIVGSSDFKVGNRCIYLRWTSFLEAVIPLL